MRLRLLQYLRQSPPNVSSLLSRCPGLLSEIDQADMRSFLGQLLLVLNVLGVGIFQRPAAATVSTIIYHTDAKGLHAEGYETDVGRLKPGISLESAAQRLQPLVQRLAEERPSLFPRNGF